MGTFQQIQRENDHSSPTYIQAHLEVGKEDDEHEKEANHVADKVMRMPEKEEEEGKMPESKLLLQKMPESPSLMKMRESPAAPKMPESGVKIQKQTNGSSAGIAAPQNVEQGINSSKGNGSSLSPDLQQELGTKMNADFSDVKVHTDENAVQMNKDVSAKAFTHGNDIYFNSGQYNPASSQEKQLLAHELTHTVQQSGVTQQKKIQRDIKENNMKVTNGEFSIDMTKKEIPPEVKGGEEGTIKFNPDKKSPLTDEIGLIQIIKNTKIDNAGTETDYADWLGDKADINSMKTAEKLVTYKTKEKETLKTIADSQTSEHITPLEIYGLNKLALGAFDENKEIPVNTELKIPKVQANYSVDHLPEDAKATKRAKKADAEVPLYYRDYAPNVLNSQDGHNKGEADIQEASLWDFPGMRSAAASIRWDFETVARSKDKGFDYGTLHWGFTLDLGAIKNEYHSVSKSTSGTFNSAIAKFNEFYANSHTVVKGDTLYNISERYLGNGNRWKEIQVANALKDETIKPGQKLIIPNITATAI